MGLSPKLQFKLNRWRNRWNNWRGSVRQTEQSLGAESKMCPSCRALVPRGKAHCPYCDQRLQVWGTGPVGKVAKRATPSIPVTGWLILANLVMFVAEYALGGTSPLTNLMGGPSGQATLRLGESLPIGYVMGLHQYWRWVTACFLHGGLLHIGFNMWALYEIGPIVESFYGGAKFLYFYVMTGIIGYIVSGIWGFTSLGASGAIFGILGVMIAYGVKGRHTSSGQQMRSLAVRWAFYALVLAFVIPGVDNAAHIGGLISGFLLGMMVKDAPPLTENQVRLWRVVQSLMLLILAASFYFMAVSPLRLG